MLRAVFLFGPGLYFLAVWGVMRAVKPKNSEKAWRSLVVIILLNCVADHIIGLRLRTNMDTPIARRRE